jgi:hypothetical protein
LSQAKFSKLSNIGINTLLYCQLKTKYTILVDNQSYVFSRKFEGKIWKTISNTSGEYLAIEIRDEANHQVSFFILDTHKRTWLWDKVTFEEQWWINLQSFSERTLQFIYYEDGNSPEQKQHLTIDIHSQEAKEGSINEMHSAIQTPVHYLEGTDHFTTVSKFIREKFNISTVKAVDYFESQEQIAISYYLWQSDQLANFLLIMDVSGIVKSHLLLANQLQTIGIDTFFMVKSSLYTIRNKAELLIYDL